MKLERWNIQKRDVQNMKCFGNVKFKIWAFVSETWRSKYKMFEKRDDQKMKIFSRNLTFKTWCFSNLTFKTLKCDPSQQKSVKCPNNVWGTWRFCNISCFERHVSKIISCLELTFYLLHITFPKHFLVRTFLTHFMFWTSLFGNISYFECHISKKFHLMNVTISKTFHDLNVTFLKHFNVRTSCFCNIWFFTFLKRFIF